MGTIQLHETVGAVVARRPGLSRVFEKTGIDYCCGGKKTLAEVCQDKGLDPQTLVTMLEESASAGGEGSVVDAAAMSLTQLADHIEQTHHAYLRNEFCRLEALTAKVASVHGGSDHRLHVLRATYLELADELSSHMIKEEHVLFPIIRLLETGGSLPGVQSSSIADPIRQMEREHHDAGAALERMRTLTDGYTPPDGACNTYRALLDALRELELDMHQHVHKEENVLFPRSLELEARLAGATPA